MATDETRAALLAVLAELGREHPNWRLGQTLSNLAMAAGRLDAGGVWDLNFHPGCASASCSRTWGIWSRTRPTKPSGMSRTSGFLAGVSIARPGDWSLSLASKSWASVAPALMRRS